VSPEHQKIVDDLLAEIQDRLGPYYVAAQRDGSTANDLAAVVGHSGGRLAVRIERRDKMRTDLRTLLHSTETAQHGMLPVIFTLNGRPVVAWLSVTALTGGGNA
jgi:hypothetical protein